MLIKISDPNFQTILFSIIFLALLLASIRKNREEPFFSEETTHQLKGFAILAVVFSHIGFFLFTDQKFLYPYSILAGVGVNLFLFLSGFGLTVSQLKSALSSLHFYQRRLLRLFVPLWITVTIFLLADLLLLKRGYPISEIINSFLGFYPRADIYQNLDSPLWYFSVILFYYLIFPLLFVKKIPLISSVLVLLLGWLMINLPLPINKDVLNLYKLHFLAFPLGMTFGLIFKHLKFRINLILKLPILTIAVLVFLYTAIHSGVGQDFKLEQGISLITMLSVIAIFSLSGLQFKMLTLFGIYSYEIYLLHWPILSRFNLFSGFPPFLMVVLNLSLIVFFGYVLQKITGRITKLLHS